MPLLDLLRQVKGVLPQRFGGTGNPNGWGAGIVVPYLNVSGGDLAIGTIVQQAGGGGARCTPCDTLDSVLVVGVVVGYYTGTGLAFVADDCPDQELAAVQIAGRCRVLVAENVAKHEYAFQSSTDGQARGDATAGAGAFGIFESIGDSGQLAYMRLFGAVVLSAGGSTSPLTTKGDLYGFSTLDARIPVGTNAYVLTADSGQSLGVKWAVIPDQLATLTTKGDLLTRNSSALARLGVGSNGQVLTADSAQATGMKWAQRDTGVQVVFYAPTNGMQVDWVAPCDGTITRWTALGDASGSAVIDIWKDTYANFPPTVADTITASAKPTISAATKGQSSTLTGWTTSFSKGDIFRFNIDSVSGLSRLALAIDFTRVG